MTNFTPEYVDKCRRQFPALSRIENERDVIFFDGPAGTQVPVTVVDAMSEYMLGCNANHGGLFTTSRQSDRWLDLAKQSCAEFVRANSVDEIVYGQNMTSLTFAFSRAISKSWDRGDEIIVTRLDHDANISPWVQAAKDAGVQVKWLPFKSDDFTLDLEILDSMLNARTRLVAVGCASNATGGINPVKAIGQLAHQHGAQVFLDAVHYAPHGSIDVVEWDCDYLVCSAYKFFGPHIGIFWGRRRLLNELDAYQVRPAGNSLPGKWMTGTQSHESIVGAMACIDYLTGLGEELSNQTDIDRRSALNIAFDQIRGYEQKLSRKMIDGLTSIPGIRIYGISDTDRLDERFPTFSITHERINTVELATYLSNHGIYVWHGNYYALEFTETLDLEPEGMVRIGLVHYNTETEIDQLLDTISHCCAAHS